MNNLQLFSLIFESMKLEENISRLYLLFSKLYTEDAEFWSRLSKEETRHADIYRTFIENHLPMTLFPEEIIDTDVNRIKSNNALIEKELEGFLVRHKRKMDAYHFAVQIEEIASEDIFQTAMSKDTDNESILLLQKINKDSLGHKQRILDIIALKETSGQKRGRGK
jgi:hypothetical protein